MVAEVMRPTWTVEIHDFRETRMKAQSLGDARVSHVEAYFYWPKSKSRPTKVNLHGEPVHSASNSCALAASVRDHGSSPWHSASNSCALAASVRDHGSSPWHSSFNSRRQRWFSFALSVSPFALFRLALCPLLFALTWGLNRTLHKHDDRKHAGKLPDTRQARCGRSGNCV